MLIKASEKDREKILDYCSTEAVFNIFIIGDIENFGFSSPYQDVWYEEKGGVLTGVALRYHDNLIVYSHLLDMKFDLIVPLIDQYNIEIVSGNGRVIDKIAPILSKGYNRNDMSFCKHEDISRLKEAKQDIRVASEEDAMKIAISYGEIDEFKALYSSDVDERYRQILNRINSGEGKHLMIIDDIAIVAHGNTSAENTMSAMIGGVFTRQDMRNKGYANQIISALIRDLKGRDKEIGMFYKDKKQGRIYKNLGFEEIGIWSTLRREKDEKDISASK